MDFLKLLRSLEELLFEALSWLIFYPLTLWRVLRAPVAMMDYSDAEQVDTVEGSYSDTLSPGLFLILTLLLVHGVEVALGINQDMGGALGSLVMSSDQNMLVFRSLMFGLYPLVFSTLLLVAQGTRLDRNQLRAPFFAQCFTTSTFALLYNFGLFAASGATEIWMLAALFAWEALISLWFVAVQAIWLHRESSMSKVRSTIAALGGFVFSLIVLATLLNVFFTNSPAAESAGAPPQLEITPATAR